MSEELIADLAIQVESHLISPTAALRKLEAAVRGLQVAASHADSREAFEASVIARKTEYDNPTVLIERNSAGDYATVRIQGEWVGWQAAMASKQSDECHLPELKRAFITIESNGGDGRTIMLKFNQKENAYAVHDFLLRGAVKANTTPEAKSDAQIRDAALEEAAKMCESQTGLGASEYAVVKGCAAAIRAMRINK